MMIEVSGTTTNTILTARDYFMCDIINTIKYSVVRWLLLQYRCQVMFIYTVIYVIVTQTVLALNLNCRLWFYFLEHNWDMLFYCLLILSVSSTYKLLETINPYLYLLLIQSQGCSDKIPLFKKGMWSIFNDLVSLVTGLIICRQPTDSSTKHVLGYVGSLIRCLDRSRDLLILWSTGLRAYKQ
jgi:hypothetical protein